MAGVAAAELLAELGVEAFPETGEILGHLDGAVVGGEEMDDGVDAAAGETRGLLHAEEVLEAGGDRGGLAVDVGDLGHAAVGEADAFGGEAIDVFAGAFEEDAFEAAIAQ